MWPKNILVYRRNGESLADLEAQLARRPPVKPGALEKFADGWGHPAPFRDDVAPTFAGFRLVKLTREEKVLPAPVIKAALAERVADVQRREGRKVTRKEKRELKEQVTEALLAKALTKVGHTLAWMNDDYVFIDAGSHNKGETLLSKLREALPPFPAMLPRLNMSPRAAMTSWLAAGEAPGDFELDCDCTLEDSAEGGAKVTVRRATLTDDDVRKHIELGKQATSCGFVWRDRIRFVLTDTLQLKRIQFLEVVQAEARDEAEDDQDAMFEATFRIMSADLAALVADLVVALGGFEA